MIFALFMTDFFDTIRTAVAVGRSGGLTSERGELPETRRLLLVDSGAAALGGAMSSSSVTTLRGKRRGRGRGRRTGLASLVTAACFARAIFFVPIIALVGQSVPVGENTVLHPAIVPALVLVPARGRHRLGGRPEDAIPAFLVIAGVPLTFSIAAGSGSA